MDKTGSEIEGLDRLLRGRHAGATVLGGSKESSGTVLTMLTAIFYTVLKSTKCFHFTKQKNYNSFTVNYTPTVG